MSNDTAGGGVGSQIVPDWAIDVLATPGDKQRLRATGEGIASIDGESIAIEDGIVDLSGHTREELQKYSESFVLRDPDSVEFLKPRQQRFRQLLRRFARRLPPGAIVADIAAADAEFASYYPTRRVLAMDLSAVRLRRGLELGRIDFAVLADIRQPPVRNGSLDAIVSTNTLNHLPEQAVPEIVAGLVRCLKPGGWLAVTLPGAAVPGVMDEAGKNRIVEHACIGGSVSRWWEHAVHARGTRLMDRVGSRAAAATKPLVDFMSSLVAVSDSLIKRSGFAKVERHWLVIRAPQESAGSKSSS